MLLWNPADQLIYNLVPFFFFNREKSLPEVQWKLQDMYWIWQLYRMQGGVKVREWKISPSNVAQGLLNKFEKN